MFQRSEKRERAQKIKKKLGNLGRGRLDPIYKKKLEGLAAFGQLGAASEICAHGITDISDFPTAFPEAEH